MSPFACRWVTSVVALAIVCAVLGLYIVRRESRPSEFWTDYSSRISHLQDVISWATKIRPSRKLVIRRLGIPEFVGTTKKYTRLNPSTWLKTKARSFNEDGLLLVYYIEEHGQDLQNSKLPSHLIFSFDSSGSFISCELRRWDEDF